jgi:hypothetical protein
MSDNTKAAVNKQIHEIWDKHGIDHLDGLGDDGYFAIVEDLQTSAPSDAIRLIELWDEWHKAV